MKIIKNCIVSLLVISLFTLFTFSESINAIAIDNSLDTVNEKQSLVDLTSHNYKHMSEVELDTRNNEIDSKIGEMIAEQENLEVIKEIMKKEGVYLLRTNLFESSSTRSIGSRDVHLNSPIIFYDSYTNQWIVAGGGYWINDNWQDDLSYWDWFSNPSDFTSEGALYNVGGTDALGIAFYNTQNPQGVARQSCYIYLTDHNGWNDSNTYTSPAPGSSTSATVIEFQPQVMDPNYWDNNWIWNKSEWKYRGRGFSITSRYNSAFANFSGTAQTIYVHTWNSTEITSISIGFSAGKDFSFGGSVGIDVSSNNAWGIASAQETGY